MGTPVDIVSTNMMDEKVRAGSVFGNTSAEHQSVGHKKLGAAALEARNKGTAVDQVRSAEEVQSLLDAKEARKEKVVDRQALAMAASKKRNAEEERLKAMFAQLDGDGSGTLDQREVRKMAKMMGDAMKPDQLRNAFAQMDKLNAGEVTFNQFKKWWFLKQEEERKDARKKARAIFDAIDIDNGGTLDKQEVGAMAKIIAKKFPKIKLDPPFDLDRDFAEMDEDGEGNVTYDEFDAWWRDRTGDDAPDIPVLPESMVKKINDLASSGSLVRPSPDHQFSANELWSYLRPRLKQLVDLQDMWGNLHNLYPTASTSSIFEDKPIPPGVRDPDSEMAGYWDLAQVFFLLYVCVTVPFRTSMDISIEYTQTEFWIDVVVDVYFIIDLYYGFITAYWTQQGVLELDKVRNTPRSLPCSGAVVVSASILSAT